MCDTLAEAPMAIRAAVIPILYEMEFPNMMACYGFLLERGTHRWHVDWHSAVDEREMPFLRYLRSIGKSAKLGAGQRPAD
jgi:hypothetical protein